MPTFDYCYIGFIYYKKENVSGIYSGSDEKKHSGETIMAKSSENAAFNSSTKMNLPDYDKQHLEDIGFLTAMTVVLMGNYAQTGHFGGPLAYTHYTVASHLIGPEMGGLRWDYRRPKHPFSDKFLLAGGHNAPVTYALWMIMGGAMDKKHAATGDDKYRVDPSVAMLPIDALGFRRSESALKTLLQDNKLDDHPLMAQAKQRGIRALSGHSETTDVTNDVNSGPSGVGIATAAGKAMFWDMVGAPASLKVMGIEGEFAMTSGHAQEMKTQAVAQKVGKRLRIMLSFNNAGIDDDLLGSIIGPEFDAYKLKDQWSSYGWNVLTLDNGNDFDQVVAAMQAMENNDPEDRRPMIVIGDTVKGWWPVVENGSIPGYGEQVVGYHSHPYAFPMNGDYFQALAGTFEKRFGVEFQGIRDGAVSDTRERLIQFKTNIDIAMSVLEQNGLGDWLSARLVSIGDSIDDSAPLRIDGGTDLFKDPRLEVKNLPMEPQTVTVKNPVSGEEKSVAIKLFEEPGNIRGTRRAISEIIKWMNYVTENRFVTIAADLAESINVEKGSIWGHYDPVKNPVGTRLKAAIQEAGNSLTAIGLVSQSVSLDPKEHVGVWALSGTYGAFTPLMYLPARVWSQQNQNNPFRVGVLNILAGHSGPETAADARTHFGIYSPQVWKLFPKGQVISLNFWDYNDVAPAYFAAAEIAARDPKVGIIVLEVARPDFPVRDRSTFADKDPKAAAKGFYVIRDFEPGQPKQGYVLVQGSSSTANLMNILPRVEEQGINVKVISAISEELFLRQPKEYRDSVLPSEALCDLMVISTGTRRVWPISDVGPLTDEYSMFSDWNNEWLTGGTEGDVISDAHLDSESIFTGIKRFADDKENRICSLRDKLANLE
jgi:transketolase